MNLMQLSKADNISISAVSLVLVCPSDRLRQTFANALQGQHAKLVRQYNAYPNSESLLTAPELDCDAVVIDIDTDPELALDLVESVCAQRSSLTVMVYARAQNPDLLVRAMRTGAREFLSDPLSTGTLADAMVRAAARRSELNAPKRVKGKVLVFWGAKGGSGVTTLASNFALSLLKEAGREVALLDLNLHIGEIALLLGLETRFTLIDALRNSARLDREFVSTLMTRHPSGLAVLAASDAYLSSVSIEDGSIERLLHILREQFAYVVVDAGPSLGRQSPALFDAADTIYLVAQADIPSLRNAQRFISNGFHAKQQQVEVVLNRFEPNRLGLDEDRISKALGVPPKWSVPNDFAAVRQAQNTGEPLVFRQSPVVRALRQMARAACGKPIEEPKKKKLSFFGL